MKRAKVTLLIDCPNQSISKEDFVEWIEFDLGIKPDIRVENELEYAEISNYIKSSQITTIT